MNFFYDFFMIVLWFFYDFIYDFFYDFIYEILSTPGEQNAAQFFFQRP